MAIDPARFGLPDASTTGVKAGTTLKPYSGPMTITQDGTVIENAVINGTLTVKAANVTIKNSVIQNFAWWGIEGEHAGGVVELRDIDHLRPDRSLVDGKRPGFVTNGKGSGLGVGARLCVHVQPRCEQADLRGPGQTAVNDATA